jgi:Questin oxidase-like
VISGHRLFAQAGAAASALCLSPRLAAGAAASAVMDEVLGLLAETGPEYGGGLSNHGPMAAEALLVLGRPESAIPWVESYRRRLREHPEGRAPIAHEDWREALGDYGRVGDWVLFFERELAESPWQGVLGRWSARLAPGMSAAAFHGLIRTAHAARSLSAGETAPRRRELAEGLGYWAARHQTLPASGVARERKETPSRAIREVPTLPAGRRRGGLITDALRALNDLPSFAEVAGLVDSSGDPSRFLSDLTETFAEVYVAKAPSGNVIAWVHSVTGPSAVRLLLPYLSADSRADVLRHAWQAAAALYAAFGGAASGAPAPEALPDREGLIDRAVATWDEHGIKFTEACLREHALNPKPVYLHAARHAAASLGRG